MPDDARNGPPDRPGARFDPDATLATGGESHAGGAIGPYRLLRILGEGGFGTVYLAEQTEPVRRTVAIKVIKAGMDTRQVIARFEAERQALARMDHPGIARVLDAGATEMGRPYFVMELVKGEPITEFARAGKLDLETRLRCFAQVCEAVQHAHQKGVLHRDIKPSNVLVHADEHGHPVAKIIDFGIAKATIGRLTDQTLVTEYRQMLGTPEYMSPEQAAGEMDVDTRSDVYALGALLYELLTGVPPFDGETLRSAGLVEVQRILQDQDPVPPSTRMHALGPDRADLGPSAERALRGDLNWIVLKCLEKDRARRYATAEALAEDVHRYLRGEPLAARPPSTAYRLSKFARRHRAGVSVAAIVVVATVIGVAGLAYGLARASANNAELEQLNDDLALSNSKLDDSLAETRDQRDRAAAAERRAEAINEYLVTDLFAAAGPNQLGHDAKVVDVLERAAEGIEERFGDDPGLRAELLMVLGQTNRHIGRLSEARRLGERADESYAEANQEDRDLLWLRIQGLLALALVNMGSPDQALVVVNDALAEPIEGATEELLGLRITLAQIYQGMEDSERAIAMLDEIVAELRALDPVPRTTLLTALASQATALQGNGDLESALAKARELRELALAWEGRNSEAAFTALNSIANALRGLGRHDEAVESAVQLAEEGAEFFPPQHPAQYAISANAGMTLRGARQYERAEPHLLRAYDKAIEIHGEHNYATERAAGFLAGLYSRWDRPEELLNWSLKRYILRLRVAGPGESESVNTSWAEAVELVDSLHETLDMTDVPTFAEHAIAEAQATPMGHPNRVRLLGNVARGLMSTDNNDQALRLLLLAEAEIDSGERPDEDRLIVYGSLAEIAKRQGDLDQSREWATHLDTP